MNVTPVFNDGRLTTETAPPSLFADEDAERYLTVHACLAEAAELWPAELYDAWLGSIEEDILSI